MTDEAAWRPTWRPKRSKKTGPSGWRKPVKAEVPDGEKPPPRPSQWVTGQQGFRHTRETLEGIFTAKQIAVILRPDAFIALEAALAVPGERVQAANTILAYSDGKPQATLNIRKITRLEDLDEEELRASDYEGVRTGRSGSSALALTPFNGLLPSIRGGSKTCYACPNLPPPQVFDGKRARTAGRSGPNRTSLG